MYTQDDFTRDVTACLNAGGNLAEVLNRLGSIVLQAQEFLTPDEIQSCLDKVEVSTVDTSALVTPRPFFTDFTDGE